MTEFNLSDKAINNKYYYYAEDVREAVRLLKERLKTVLGTTEIHQLIDEIFGDKLI